MTRIATTSRTGQERKPRVERERTMQVNLFKWAAMSEAGRPALKLLFAVPNGGARPEKINAQGRRYSVAAVRMRAEGVKRGVPDICLPVARAGFHGLWIELKAGKNRTSEDQERWLKALAREGFAIAVVFDEWLKAKDLIEQYLDGKLEPMVAAKGQ